MTILGTDVFGKQAGVTSAARTPGLGRWSLANLPTPVPPKHLPQIQSNVLPESPRGPPPPPIELLPRSHGRSIIGQVMCQSVSSLLQLTLKLVRLLKDPENDLPH